MCSLILAHGILESHDWLIAANRDEKLDRPSESPRVRDRTPGVFAPLDKQEGGTWLGVNNQGVLAAITNRFGPPRDGDRRSRGEIVFDALERTSAEDAAELIQSRSAHDYNGFHLILADSQSAFIVWSDLEELHLLELGKGIHIVTERSFGAAENRRSEFLSDAVAELVAADRFVPDELAKTLRVCRKGDIDSTCVYMPEMNYGTRSSALVAVGKERLFKFSEGPPCEAAYTDLSEEFRSFLI